MIFCCMYIYRYRHTMKLHLAIAAALVAVSKADDISTTTQCSCSPTTYNFHLNFSGTCTSSVGLDDKPESVEGSVCFFTKGDPTDIEDGATIDFGGSPTSRMGEKEARRNYVGLRKLRSGEEEEQSSTGRQRRRWRRSLLEGVDFTKEREYAKMLAAKQQQQHQQQQQRQDGGRTLQGGLDTTPTIVTSVTFLEADSTPQLNIINQDSTYFNTSSSDGDVLSYTSISSSLDVTQSLTDQENLVPGGVMMVLFGINSASEVIQNTIAWAYNLDNCDVEPLEEGDGVGWATVGGGNEPPHAAFCDGVTDVPTASPVTTSPVTTSPTDPPVVGSTMATIATTTTEAAITTSQVVTSEATESPATTTHATTVVVVAGKSTKGTKSTKGSKSSSEGGIFDKSGKTGKSNNNDAEEYETDAKAEKMVGTSECFYRFFRVRIYIAVFLFL
mmetsp:Transcript_12116/g.26122  ORF Transcript_12116/g.26122 Transcript_12116/m.26122 type:complete len:443 (+) Transcript_12116:528-1856(+)